MTGLEPATSWSLTRCATNCATSRGPFFKRDCKYRYSIPKKQEKDHLFFGGGRRQGFLPGLQGRLEGRGGAEAADWAVDDGEGVQVFLQFVGGEAGIEAGQLAGEEGEAVADAQRIVFAEVALRPAEEGQAGTDFLFDQGGIGGRGGRGVVDAFPADGTDAGLLRGGEDDGVAHAGGFGIRFEGFPESAGTEDKGGKGRHSPVDENICKNAVRARPEPPLPVRFRQVPVEDVIGVVSVDAAAHALDARFVQVHAGREEAHPFRLGNDVQTAFPQGLPGLLHRHDGYREPVLEIRNDGTHGLGTGEVCDDDPEGAALLERKHGKEPVESIQVPGRNDERNLCHNKGFYPCKDSENALHL